jgi:hypothetical protein
MSKTRNVTIETSRNSSGDIEFSMKEGGTETELLVFDKNKDKMKKSEHYDIVFTLRNGNGINLSFVTQNSDGPVMHIAAGSWKHVPKCPAGASSGNNQDFSVTSVTANELKVKNEDSTECFYKFVLRFIDTSGNIHVFDPIYDNRDGGSESFASFTDIFSGGVTGGVAGLATILLSGMAATTPMLTKGVLVGALAGIVAMLVISMLRGGQRGEPA